MNLKEKEIPEYYGKPYAEISDNKPDFQEMTQVETYKKLGGFKSCGESTKYILRMFVSEANLYRKVNTGIIKR